MTALPPQKSDRLSRSSSVQETEKPPCAETDADALTDSCVATHDRRSSAGHVRTLVKRRDFLKAARAQRWVTPGFILQARNRKDDDRAIGVGITASKKVGNAVVRNRAKRRLRMLVRDIISQYCKDGYDLVLVARHRDKELGFDSLRRDLKWALKRLGLRRDIKNDA